jgi:small-conductance mechanosensitive channel
VLLTFESDWRKAKEILTGIAQTHASGMIEEAERSVRRASRKFMIFYPNLSPIVYTNVKDSGVELTIRYLCKPRARRGTAEKIWEDVLQAFADHDDIDFAYPTTRAYFNPLEGKPGARQELPGRPPPAPPDRQADPGVGEGDQS